MAPAPMAIPDNQLSFAVKNILTSIYGDLPCDVRIPCFALNKVMRRKVADVNNVPAPASEICWNEVGFLRCK